MALTEFACATELAPNTVAFVALACMLEFLPTTVAFAALAWTELSEPITIAFAALAWTELYEPITTANGDADEATCPITTESFPSTVVVACTPAVTENVPCAPAYELTGPSLVLKLSAEGCLSTSSTPLFTWK